MVFSHPFENYAPQVKLDHVSPILGVKIPEIFETTTKTEMFLFFGNQKNPSKHNMSEAMFGGEMFGVLEVDVGGWHVGKHQVARYGKTRI